MSVLSIYFDFINISTYCLNRTGIIISELVKKTEIFQMQWKSILSALSGFYKIHATFFIMVFSSFKYKINLGNIFLCFLYSKIYSIIQMEDILWLLKVVFISGRSFRCDKWTYYRTGKQVRWMEREWLFYLVAGVIIWKNPMNHVNL